MGNGLVFVIVAHAIAIVALVWLIMRRRLKVSVDVEVKRLPIDFAALSAFAKEKHERIGEYVRANWSGMPEQLPPVLEALLQDLERDAESRNLGLDRETLKNLLETSLQAHRVAPSGKLREGLRRIA